ncbi:YqaJ viral recombinase family protein [Ideonella sp. TBM-1]|uniref:YqaJ viral recombinase family protein n=1 Tax=Ideonella livida TaxID=2707176 RepID=A0A7C9TJN3_9BURK|nr:YqaJ viral recombinase family protein [Ideonella livida]
MLTASLFAQAIGTTSRGSAGRTRGDATASSEELAAILACERISGKPYRALLDNEWTSFGHEQEPMAKIEYLERTGIATDDAGLILTDDRKFGYSTDGEAEDRHGLGLVEVKSLASARRIAEFLCAPDKREWAMGQFKPQCKGGLWLTNRAWLDLIVWIPSMESVNKHFWSWRIWRDDDELEQMEEQLWRFMRRVDGLEAIFRAPPLQDELISLGLPPAIRHGAPTEQPELVAAQAATTTELPLSLF